MLVWALAVLHELEPATWTALLDFIAAAPADTLAEVRKEKKSKAEAMLLSIIMGASGLKSSPHCYLL